MKQKFPVFIMMVLCFLSFGFLASEAHANIVIKVRALNPFERQEVASIHYPLPQEISPSDIISKKITFSLPPEEGQERKSTFNVEYVQEEGRYFIVDEVTMGPREVVTLEVHVRDIWTIPQERLESIKQTVEDLIAQHPPAQDTSSDEESPEGDSESADESAEESADETITILQEGIFEQIDEIAAHQQESSVLKVGVEKHMEAYYENMEALAQVEADVQMLKYLMEPEDEEAGEAAEEEQENEELSAGEDLLGEETLTSDPIDSTSGDGAMELKGNIAE